MKNIFTRIAYERQEHRDLVMVTILSDEGSTPRGKGSMMLVGGGGQLLGTIGGGAVEKQSELRALRLLEERQSEVHGYRLRRNAAEDIGMVCGGDVDVHFQFIDADDARWDGFVREVLSRIDAQEPGVLVLKHDGSFPALADADGNTLAGGRGTGVHEGGAASDGAGRDLRCGPLRESALPDPPDGGIPGRDLR